MDRRFLLGGGGLFRTLYSDPTNRRTPIMTLQHKQACFKPFHPNQPTNEPPPSQPNTKKTGRRRRCGQ